MFIRRLIFSIVIFIFIINLSTFSFASASAHCFGDINITYAEDCVDYSIIGFNRLNYSPVYNTYGAIAREGILSWIGNTGNGYGFSIRAAGSSTFFYDSYNNKITPSDISGNWDLVFLDSGYSAANTNFASAFKTIGYSNRGFIGWDSSVTASNSELFNYYLWNIYVTSNTINNAVSLSASQISGTTSPVYYGDTSWYGYAR